MISSSTSGRPRKLAPAKWVLEALPLKRAAARKWLVSAVVAAALAPNGALAAEPALDEDLLEFLGSVDEVEDEGFQEYLAAVDLQRVVKGAKPGLPRVDAKTNAPQAPPAKPAEPKRKEVEARPYG